MSKARRRLRPLSLAILRFNPSASAHPSRFPAAFSTAQISSSVGAATLTSRVLDRIGAMIFDVLFASNINLKFGLYFSMVRLNAACASLVK